MLPLDDTPHVEYNVPVYPARQVPLHLFPCAMVEQLNAPLTGAGGLPPQGPAGTKQQQVAANCRGSCLHPCTVTKIMSCIQLCKLCQERSRLLLETNDSLQASRDKAPKGECMSYMRHGIVDQLLIFCGMPCLPGRWQNTTGMH